MIKGFYNAVEKRRSYYGISKETVISDDRLKEVVEHAVKHTPTAFNSQSGRVIILLGDHHTKLWDMTMEALRKIVPADHFSSTEDRIHSFNNGYGTILFFEDQKAVEELQTRFELYKHNFPIWSEQSSGMLQYIIWTSLELEGLGASLQHYNELIEEDVKKEWNIPGTWKLIAQMPFGKPTAKPEEKEFQSIEERLIIFR